jgi:hypothetical protein
MLKFLKGRSNVKVRRSKILAPIKRACHIRNTHMKYQSPITYHSKVIANVNVFNKYVKLQGQVHMVKNFNTSRSLVIRNTHTKYQSPITYNSKDMANVKSFFKSRSNFKVNVRRSNILVQIERSCYEEYTYEI